MNDGWTKEEIQGFIDENKPPMGFTATTIKLPTNKGHFEFGSQNIFTTKAPNILLRMFCWCLGIKAEVLK